MASRQGQNCNHDFPNVYAVNAKNQNEGFCNSMYVKGILFCAAITEVNLTC